MTLARRQYPGACSTDPHEGGPYPLDRHMESTPPWVMDLLACGEGYEPVREIRVKREIRTKTPSPLERVLQCLPFARTAA